MVDNAQHCRSIKTSIATQYIMREVSLKLSLSVVQFLRTVINERRQSPLSNSPNIIYPRFARIDVSWSEPALYYTVQCRASRYKCSTFIIYS